VRRAISEAWSWVKAAGAVFAFVAGFVGVVLLVVNPKAGLILLALGFAGYFINTYM